MFLQSLVLRLQVGVSQVSNTKCAPHPVQTGQLDKVLWFLNLGQSAQYKPPGSPAISPFCPSYHPQLAQAICCPLSKSSISPRRKLSARTLPYLNQLSRSPKMPKVAWGEFHGRSSKHYMTTDNTASVYWGLQQEDKETLYLVVGAPLVASISFQS